MQGGSTSNYGSISQDGDEDEKIHYVKLHAPINELYEAAEDLSMKMPTSLNDIEIKNWWDQALPKLPKPRSTTPYFYFANVIFLY